LLNARYRGVYLHGRIKKVRQAGALKRLKADPTEMIATEVPDWRIVDDDTWFAVQERFKARNADPTTDPRRNASKYPLTGLARCGVCAGAIVSHRVRTYGGGAQRVLAYGCGQHRDRGNAVCAVTVYQTQEEVEGALLHELQAHVLGESMLSMVVARIREAIAEQLPERHADIAKLEAELAGVRIEQKRLAKAVAMADDVPELVSELHQRSSRIRSLEAQLLAARRTPKELASIVDRVEATVRSNVADLQNALRDQKDLRHVFQALFPSGLTFTPAREPDGTRQIWKIEGEADLAMLAGSSGESRFRTSSDPDGARRNREELPKAARAILVAWPFQSLSWRFRATRTRLSARRSRSSYAASRCARDRPAAAQIVTDFGPTISSSTVAFNQNVMRSSNHIATAA
jgi:site-specific DNA recombinase